MNIEKLFNELHRIIVDEQKFNDPVVVMHPKDYEDFARTINLREWPMVTNVNYCVFRDFTIHRYSTFGAGKIKVMEKKDFEIISGVIAKDTISKIIFNDKHRVNI